MWLGDSEVFQQTYLSWEKLQNFQETKAEVRGKTQLSRLLFLLLKLGSSKQVCKLTVLDPLCFAVLPVTKQARSASQGFLTS